MTDLPHHISSQSEISFLVKKFKLILVQLREASLQEASLLPKLVTMARQVQSRMMCTLVAGVFRSSNDPYTPQDQVSKIQAAVLDTLSSIWTVRMATFAHYTQ